MSWISAHRAVAHLLDQCLAGRAVAAHHPGGDLEVLLLGGLPGLEDPAGAARVRREILLHEHVHALLRRRRPRGSGERQRAWCRGPRRPAPGSRSPCDRRRSPRSGGPAARRSCRQTAGRGPCANPSAGPQKGRPWPRASPGRRGPTGRWLPPRCRARRIRQWPAESCCSRRREPAERPRPPTPQPRPPGQCASENRGATGRPCYPEP